MGHFAGRFFQRLSNLARRPSKDPIKEKSEGSKQKTAKLIDSSNYSHASVLFALLHTFYGSLVREILKALVLPGFSLLVLQVQVNMVEGFTLNSILVWMAIEVV